jgi:hypothetical protein
MRHTLHVVSTKDILTRPETTHVLVGNEKVIKLSVEGLATVKSTIDLFSFKKIDYYSSLIFGHNINLLIAFLQRARKIP